MQIDNATIPPDQTIVVRAVKLRSGSKVVARVIKGPGKDGRGVLSLGGAIVRAKLPAGVRAGQRLRLMVLTQSTNQVVLRMVRFGPSPRPTTPPSAVKSAKLLSVNIG